MTGDDDFVTRLMGFGLTEKEAHCYLHLLKYGPKIPSSLAKALHTYREDTQRALTALIEKGMVRSSSNSATLYAAVDLETALDSALKKHESELREMEMRKRELEELSRQQQFRPSEEVSTFHVLKNIREIVSTAIPVILSAEQEFLWVSPKEGLSLASVFGVNEAVAELTQRGGKTRGITNIVYEAIPLVHEVIDVGEEIRHFDGYQGLFYGVFDRRHCISAINIDVRHINLDEPATMLYTDDAVYATYLASNFEMLWKQSIPAEERIQELLEQGPPAEGA